MTVPIVLSDEHLQFLYGLAEGLGFYANNNVAQGTNSYKHSTGMSMGNQLKACMTPVMVPTATDINDLVVRLNAQDKKIKELEELIELQRLAGDPKFGAF